MVVATRLTQGCAPVGPQARVTDARHNILISSTAARRSTCSREDIGRELSGNLGCVAGRVSSPASRSNGSDTGDYLVRNLVGLDTAHKLVAVGEPVRPGRSIMFCRRDRGTASDDLDRMLTSIKSGLFRQPQGRCLFFLPGTRRQPVRRELRGAAHHPRPAWATFRSSASSATARSPTTGCTATPAS